MSEIPQDLRYTEEHEYVKRAEEPDTVYIGITDYGHRGVPDVFLNAPQMVEQIAGKIRGVQESTGQAVGSIRGIAGVIGGTLVPLEARDGQVLLARAQGAAYRVTLSRDRLAVEGALAAAGVSAGIDLAHAGWLFVVTPMLSNLVSNVPAVMLLLPAATGPNAGALLATNPISQSRQRLSQRAAHRNRSLADGRAAVRAQVDFGGPQVGLSDDMAGGQRAGRHEAGPEDIDGHGQVDVPVGRALGATQAHPGAAPQAGALRNVGLHAFAGSQAQPRVELADVRGEERRHRDQRRGMGRARSAQARSGHRSAGRRRP